VTDARGVALAALVRIDHERAFANLVLDGELGRSDLDQRDRAFVTELVYGTTRMRRACDAALDRFVQREPAPRIRSLLRLGAYQLVFAGVAPHAAVNSTVALAPVRLRSFANAVLRRVADEPMVWPDLATRLSYPDWIVERLAGELGEADAVAALERMNVPPPVTVRADGYAQDMASQWVAELVEARAGDRVADLCAAPGGKATALAGCGANVVAADRRPSRARLLAANAARLATEGLAVVTADATSPPFRPGSFDRVLVDAPCSGLGALRRRPDARWRVEPKDIAGLAVLQRRMLDTAWELVRPGGMLVYSVCTLTAAESIDHDDRGQLVAPPPSPPWRPYGRGARLLPQDADTDGMTILRYVRPT
jgi:16S rRNA (cytosine967-C5)-methyltransferase